MHFNNIFIFKMQAAAVAARLAQSPGNTVHEDVKLPDKIASILNGNNDELDNIQSVANCKITPSHESGE